MVLALELDNLIMVHIHGLVIQRYYVTDVYIDERIMITPLELISIIFCMCMMLHYNTQLSLYYQSTNFHDQGYHGCISV